MGDRKNLEQPKQDKNLSAKKELTEAEIKAKDTVKPPKKLSEKVNSAWSEVQSSDEDDQNQPSSQVSSLWSFLRNQDVRSHNETTKKNYPTAVIGKKRVREIDRDDDANLHDSDYEEADYDYGSGEDNCPLKDYVMEQDGKDAKAESKMVLEDVAGRTDINFTIPEYKPKGEHAEPKKQEEISKEEDEERRAWKSLNAFLGTIVPKAASQEYVKWNDACIAFFAQTKSLGSKQNAETPFPSIVHQDCGYGGRDCLKVERMGICQHDVLRVLKGSGIQTEGELWVERLKRERLRWHPDKFRSKMGKQWEGEAKEMFQMVQVLIERAES